MLLQSALVALAATAVAAVPALEIKGSDFINSKTGDKFEIVGVAYQPGGSAGYDPKTGKDPLSHADTCLRDAALLQILGVNTIRVYNLDPNINHDECASIFNAAGMYMMLDVNSPLGGEAITTLEPWTSYYMEYLNRTFAVVEAFANYPNTLLFFSGNEVINDVESAEFVPPYLRAVTRDLKNYIKNNIDRQIPVGYSAADVRDVLWDTYNYVSCSLEDDDGDMSKADIFALNSYSWCGPKATFESSTYGDLVEGFEDTAIPVFFSEYGCIEPKPRYWNETHSIYGSDMYPIWSGGVVYEYTEEENGYGLVSVEDDKLTILGDFNRLKAQFAALDWEKIQAQSPRSTVKEAVSCKSSLIKEKGFDSNFTLPVVPPGAQKLINKGISPKPSGKLVDISSYSVKLSVEDADGKTLTGLKVVPLDDDEFNWPGKNAAETGSGNDDDKSTSDSDDDSDNSTPADSSTQDDDDAAVMARPLMWALALPLVAMVFA